MASRQDMTMVIFRGARREAEVRINADPDDTEELGQHLASWLEAHRWNRNTWSEFTADVHGPRRKIQIRPVT